MSSNYYYHYYYYVGQLDCSRESILYHYDGCLKQSHSASNPRRIHHVDRTFVISSAPIRLTREFLQHLHSVKSSPSGILVTNEVDSFT